MKAYIVGTQAYIVGTQQKCINNALLIQCKYPQHIFVEK